MACVVPCIFGGGGRVDGGEGGGEERMGGERGGAGCGAEGGCACENCSSLRWLSSVFCAL